MWRFVAQVVGFGRFIIYFGDSAGNISPVERPAGETIHLNHLRAKVSAVNVKCLAVNEACDDSSEVGAGWTKLMSL